MIGSCWKATIFSGILSDGIWVKRERNKINLLDDKLTFLQKKRKIKEKKSVQLLYDCDPHQETR